MTEDRSTEYSTPRASPLATDSGEALVRDNIAWMLALSERLLRDRDQAEDVVQVAFLSAFKALDSFEGRSDIKTWLHRITVNACLSALRKSNRLAELSIDEYLPEFDSQDCRIEAPWTSLLSAQDAFEKAEIRASVKSGIGQLPESYRLIIQLRDIEGYSTSEVAELLDISKSNVKIRLHRARAALKKILEPTLRSEGHL